MPSTYLASSGLQSLISCSSQTAEHKEQFPLAASFRTNDGLDDSIKNFQEYFFALKTKLDIIRSLQITTVQKKLHVVKLNKGHVSFQINIFNSDKITFSYLAILFQTQYNRVKTSMNIKLMQS